MISFDSLLTLPWQFTFSTTVLTRKTDKKQIFTVHTYAVAQHKLAMYGMEDPPVSVGAGKFDVQSGIYFQYFFMLPVSLEAWSHNS